MSAPETAEPSVSAALPWWKTGVVYQVYPRSFQDSDGDGVGDLPGITSRLGYLAALGVDCVWLSPFYPSPMTDFGYDVSDYCDVDPRFGTLGDFDALVRHAHGLGLRVIVDFVPNHTSDQHPWFQESRAGRDNPRRDWYIWADGRDGARGRVPPNNWSATFGGSAWEFDATSGQWYDHSFLASQPDLNWRNPAVRSTMADALRFWLDRGVDGFRIDVANAIMKDPGLRDNPPAPDDWRAAGLMKDMGEFGRQLHVHDRAHPDIHAVYREWRALVEEYERRDGRPRFLVGEIHEPDWPRWASYFGATSDGLHMPFNFALLKVGWNAEEVRALVEGCEAAVTSVAHAWPNYVLGNHDEHRIASRVGVRQARVAMLLLLTLRGQPTIYYGDEFGMRDVPIPDERQQDPWGRSVGRGLGRDPERTPMPWDASPGNGFTTPEATPWLPFGDDTAEVNVDGESTDSSSMLAFTRATLAVRRAHPALSAGSYTSIDDGPPGVLLYERKHTGDVCVVALGLTDEARTVALPGRRGTIVLHTDLGRVGEPVLGGVTLRGDEGVVIATDP